MSTLYLWTTLVGDIGPPPGQGKPNTEGRGDAVDWTLSTARRETPATPSFGVAGLGVTAMKTYQKRPIRIQPVQLTDATFDGPHPNPEHLKGVIYHSASRSALINTLEGTMHASLGDWIIRGIKGELYPCKPDIFAGSYDEVDEPGPL